MELAGKIERARQLRRAAMITAEGYSDEQAARVPALYPAWRAGETVREGDRRYFEPKLYKCRQSHTSQAGWEPDKALNLWAVIDVTHAGTAEDPIPASRGMDYEYSKYYLDPEDGKTYLCRREGAVEGETVNLQYLPHEVVGQYFEEAAS